MRRHYSHVFKLFKLKFDSIIASELAAKLVTDLTEGGLVSWQSGTGVTGVLILCCV